MNLHRVLSLLLVAAPCAFGVGPPPPPGLIPTTTKLQSPKGAEQSLSLGMVKAVAQPIITISPYVILPNSLYITNITVNGPIVTLKWQGSGTIQVQESPDRETWSDVGAPVTGNIAAVPRNAPQAFYRLKLLPPQTPGECLLQRSFGGTNANGSATTKASVRDHAGNLIIVGLMYYSVNLGNGVLTSYGGQDAFIAKYAPDGTCLWSKHLGNVSNDAANGVAVDSADNVIVTGSFSGTTFPGTLDFGLGPMNCHGGSEIFVAKFDSNGVPIWSKLFGGTGSDQGIAVAVDVVDYIFITGTHGFFGSGVDFGGGTLSTYGQQDVFLAKLNPSGAHVWSKSFGGSDSDLVTALAVDMVNPVIVGHFRGSANFGNGIISSVGDTDAYVVRYAGSDGAFQWLHKFGDARSQSATGVTVDTTGNITLCGDFIGSIDFGDGETAAQPGGSFYAASYGVTGELRWHQQFGAPDNGPHAAGIASTVRGPVVVGEMITGIDFGTGWLLGQGGNDAMVVQFDNAGAVVWAKRGAPYGNRASAVCVPLTVSGDNGSQQQDFGCDVIMTTLGTINNGYWVRFTE